jgi:O-antigen/teichoic acid export membrane protein
VNDTQALTERAGHAVRWRTAHLIGVNVTYFLRIVILARILEPEAFGLLAIARVPIGVLLQVTEFGMIPALIHAKNPEQRHYDVAWTIGLARGIVTATVVLLAAPWVATLAKEPRAVEIIAVLSLHPLLIAASSIRLADLQRRLDFRPLAFLHLGEAAANTLLSIALAPFLGVWGLVAGTLAGSGGRLVISYLVAPHTPRLAFKASAAASLIRFGRWVFVTALLTTLGGATLQMIISRQLGAAEVGIYYLGTRVTFLLVGGVIDVGTSVSFPIYARMQEAREEASRIFRATLTASSTLVIPAMGLMAALAPSLVTHVLGEQWAGTEPVIRTLAIVSILSLFGDVSLPLWSGMGQPWRTTLIEAVQLVLLVSGAWYLTLQMGVVGAALAWIPAILATQLITLFFLPRVLPRPLAGLFSIGLGLLAAAAAAIAIAMWIEAQFGGLGGLITGLLAGAGVYVGLLVVIDGRLGLGLTESLFRVFPQLRPKRSSPGAH